MHDTPTHRAVIGSGALALTAAPVVAVASTNLHAELLASEAWRDRLDAANVAGSPASPSEWEAWEESDSSVLARIEALPVNRDNAPIKARAVSMLYRGRLGEMFSGETTDVRLVRQIVAGMANHV